MDYTLTTTVDADFDATLIATRAQLAEVGFGVLTEIDLAATLKTKLDVDIAPQVILGACRPPLAHAALQAEPSIGVLLPCNVVVRTLEAGRTIVEAMDPATMVELTGNDRLADVAADARERLSRALKALASPA
ncbi:DUF302 domain-containing protein [Terrabacter sp. C0L_2]|uniref:DUF302 domain-containing protein n=1 Tax=Terrabacter sp. C0L_2 TaxID=3108389 RepID=UPI0017E0E7F6|nr:DUF302 domain-containing protein [Dermatophilaceae bacterium]WVM95426.1 DUF302 domain-containing protein [Terrabacter sp. C0L_2]